MQFQGSFLMFEFSTDFCDEIRGILSSSDERKKSTDNRKSIESPAGGRLKRDHRVDGCVWSI